MAESKAHQGQEAQYTGIGVGLGAGVGATVGVLLGGGVGVALGLCVGGAVGGGGRGGVRCPMSDRGWSNGRLRRTDARSCPRRMACRRGRAGAIGDGGVA